MLTDFLQSWSMFQHSYLAALACGVLLSVLGVWVVGRDEIFLAAAVAQASVLGVVIALGFGWSTGSTPAAACSVAFSIVAALLSGGRHRRGGTSREEMTGWTFLVASSVAVLLLARSPIGMKNVQSLLTSTLLGATPWDAWLFVALALAALGLACIGSQRLTLLVLDPVMAAAVGLGVGTWSLAMSTSLGLATGLAIRSTGFLFAFGCLVLPALVAKNLCRRVRPMFLLAPVVAALAVLLGLFLAHGFDYPPGQLVVALLGFALLLAWLGRALRERLAA